MPSTTPAPTTSESEESEAAPTEKRPGAVRVGVVSVTNKTGVQVQQQRANIVASIRRALMDAVPIDATSDAEIQAEAKQKQCDYILYTDVSSLKVATAGSKVGGFFGKAVGQGGTGNVESTLKYRLLQTGSPTPQLESSQSAREGATAEDSVKSALEREVRDVVTNIHKMR